MIVGYYKALDFSVLNGFILSSFIENKPGRQV